MEPRSPEAAWSFFKRSARRGWMLVRRMQFALFFKRRPRAGDYCNSKALGHVETASSGQHRPFLVFVRAGSGHRIGGIHSDRNFDIALNHYARPAGELSFDYRVAGGLSKFRAAEEFLSSPGLPRYDGYMFLDDDVEISCDELSAFLEYCRVHDLEFAQPSLTPDSFYSHGHLLNRPGGGHREVHMVEVMMPFFSRTQLARVLETFGKSISTWGLDVVWPRLVTASPTVVDRFQARHAAAVGGGTFYEYLRSIGVSAPEEMRRLMREYGQTGEGG